MITYKKWKEEAKRRYPDGNVVFRCPCCGFVQSIAEYRAAGVPEGAWGFSCIGRWIGAKREAFCEKKINGPCNYAGGGLVGVNPVYVVFAEDLPEDLPGDDKMVLFKAFFDFADDPLEAKA